MSRLLPLFLLACAVPSDPIGSSASSTIEASDGPHLSAVTATQAGLDLDLAVTLDSPATLERPTELAWSDGSSSQVLLSFVDGVAPARVPFADPCSAIADHATTFVLRIDGWDIEVNVPLVGTAADASAGAPVAVADSLTVVCNVADGVPIPLALTGGGIYTFTVPIGRGLVLQPGPAGPFGVSFTGAAELPLDPALGATLTVRGDFLATIEH